MKTYHTQYRVGEVKYLVNFHNGQKVHQDGSEFFDIRTFRNKHKLAAFINTLKQQGYAEKIA